MKLIDRMLLRGYLKAYAVCFFSLVSLYIIIHLFSNLDEFSESTQGIVDLLRTMGIYYSYQIVLIFDRLSGVIVQLAAMFTIAWMQKNNELLPLLSAGVSTRRVLRPIFLGTLLMVTLSVANREFLMPRIADKLQNPAEDPEGEEARQVNGGYEPNGILITGVWAYPQEQLVREFSCTLPEKLVGGMCHIRAKEARYLPPGATRYNGGWLLTQTSPADLPNWKEPVLEIIDTGKFFLHTERVDFQLLTRNRSWYQFASTPDLFRDLQQPASTRLAAMAMHLHQRLTVPVLTLIMVLMGLALILKEQNRHVFLNAGLCLLLAAAFYASGYFCRYLGDYEYLAPALAAWLPVLTFGPLALAMFDAIHT